MCLVQEFPAKRYLRCPAAVTIAHLQKLIRAKYGLSPEHRVDIMHMDDTLNEEFTLMDVAYIYRWRRVNVIRKLVCVWASGGHRFFVPVTTLVYVGT